MRSSLYTHPTHTLWGWDWKGNEKCIENFSKKTWRKNANKKIHIGYNFKMDLTEIIWENVLWIFLYQVRCTRLALMNMVMNLLVPLSDGNVFLNNYFYSQEGLGSMELICSGFGSSIYYMKGIFR
jgi:hypothetical protein